MKVEVIIKLVCSVCERLEIEDLGSLCFVLMIFKVCYDYDIFLGGKDFNFLDFCVDILIL